jgi:4-hydroxybenzoyl-CoA thioesterase
LSGINAFTVRLPIRFTHTDPGGFVFFPRYFEMLQAAVEDWFNYGLEVSYAGLIASGFGLPTAQTECEFLKPSRLGEILELAVILERLGNSSMTVRFVGSVDGEERVRAKSVLVLISLEDGRPRPIEGDLRAKLMAYMKELDQSPA